MKWTSVVFVIALLVATASASAAPYSRYNNRPSYDNSGLHFTIGGGITCCGDTLGTVYYSGGDSADIQAGALLHFYGGGIYHFYNSPLALRMALGYHFDQANASNGTVTFDRTTFEVTPLFYFPAYSRLGLGWIRHMNPTLDESDFTGNIFHFKDANGVLFEYGYNAFPHGWIDFRYVNIQYKLDEPGITDTVNGSHFGIYMSGEF